MIKPRYKPKHSIRTGRDCWHKIVCFLLAFTMIAASFPSDAFTVFAEKVQNTDAVLQQDSEELSGENGVETGGKEYEPEKPDESGKTDYPNSISGSLWLDISEDAEHGVFNGDGIRQSGEQPLADYEVSLYKADNKADAVETVTTNSDGTYRFENMEPGSYVVGISGTTINGTEYLLPIAGITADNRFADFNDDYTTVYSEPIAMEAGTQAVNIDAGMRTPPDVMPFGAIEYAEDESTLRTAFAKVDNGGTIQIKKDIELPKSITIPAGKSITLTSAPGGLYTIKQSSRGNGVVHFEVSGSLTLKDISLSGTAYSSSASSSQESGGVRISSNGILTMESGAKITKCFSGTNGGAVHVGSDAVFNMKGGEISANSAYKEGGGVFVNSGGEFVMDDGEISGNSVYFASGGGVCVQSGATFTMKGGKIFGSTSNYGAGAVCTSGTGSSFIMEGGEIFDSTLEYAGGGVCVFSGATFTMKAGKIYNNEIRSQDGGGVFVDAKSSFFMEGGEISGNKAVTNGGGVYVEAHSKYAGSNTGTFTMTGGEISGNEAKNGAGVYVNSYNNVIGTFTMDGGQISGNKAAANGGGVYLSFRNTAAYAFFKMTGGEISGNTAGADGGGIYTINCIYDQNPISSPASYYNNISIASSATVEKNTAGDAVGAQAPPGNYDYYTNRTPNPFDGLLLDNDNINYRNPHLRALFKANNDKVPAEPDYAIQTGSKVATSITMPTLAEAGFTAPDGKVFLGWAESKGGTADGGNLPGKQVVISANKTFYASWGTARYLVYRDSDDAFIAGRDTLKAAVAICDNYAASGSYTIVDTQDDPDMGLGVEIPATKKITLTSDNTIRTIKQTDTSLDGRHFAVKGGSLTIKNVVLAGMGSRATALQRNGGVEIEEAGSFTMEEGAKITDCSINQNGSAVRIASGTFTMNDGEISNGYTRTSSYGGAVSITEKGIFTMNGGKIIGNEAAGHAGAVYVAVKLGVGGGTFTMNGGEITGNKAGGDGGAIYAGKLTQGTKQELATIILNGGKISDNTAVKNGGAIYVGDYKYTDPIEPAADYYKKIHISDQVVFSGNTAVKTHMPPSNYTDFTNRSVDSFDGMLLDNDNINYENPARTVAYHANNGSEEKYFQKLPGSSITIPAADVGTGTGEANFTAPEGKVFEKWTENADGTGTAYAPGDLVTVTAQVKSKSLYAKWREAVKVDLTLSKTVEGDYGDKNKVFDFTITLLNNQGTPLTGTFAYTGGTISGSGAAAPSDDTLNLDSTGSAVLQLKHGQTITVKNIPETSKVRIKEDDTIAAGYSTTYKIDNGSSKSGMDTGAVTIPGTNCRIDFVNARSSVVSAGVSGGRMQNAISLSGTVLSLTGACYVLSRFVKRRRHG